MNSISILIVFFSKKNPPKHEERLYRPMWIVHEKIHVTNKIIDYNIYNIK